MTDLIVESSSEVELSPADSVTAGCLVSLMVDWVLPTLLVDDGSLETSVLRNGSSPYSERTVIILMILFFRSGMRDLVGDAVLDPESEVADGCEA